MDTFDPENIFYIIKINNFRGELTDNSAKKEALLWAHGLRRVEEIIHDVDRFPECNRTVLIYYYISYR